MCGIAVVYGEPVWLGPTTAPQGRICPICRRAAAKAVKAALEEQRAPLVS